MLPNHDPVPHGPTRAPRVFPKQDLACPAISQRHLLAAAAGLAPASTPLSLMRFARFQSGA